MDEETKNAIVELTPQVCFIFHGADASMIDSIKPPEGKNASAVYTNHEKMTIVDFRSGFIYVIDGENTKIISYKSGLPAPSAVNPYQGMMVPVEFQPQSPGNGPEPFIA